MPSSDRPRITAVVCTRNRASHYLPKALDSLLKQTLPQPLFEILVVDNASTDETTTLVAGYQNKHPSLRYVRESRIGISPARNCGWREARGEWVAYLDDDCLASPTWLSEILKAFEEVTPTPGCVGGKIGLRWEGERPTWLADEILPGLGLMDWSNEPLLLEEHQFFGEGNSAYPRQLLEDIGGFDESLGRQDQRLLSNEGVWVRRRIEALGYRFYYSPHIFIEHHVAVHKLSRSWCYRMFFWQGASDALVTLLEQTGQGQRRLPLLRRLGRLLHVSARMLKTLRFAPMMLLQSGQPRWFYQRCRLCSQAGEWWTWGGGVRVNQEERREGAGGGD